jgi:anthranilate phosphoribosyltransferase
MMIEHLEKILTRKDLEALEMASAMEEIMDGNIPDTQMAAFLAALRVKGETEIEIAEAAKVMRQKAVPVKINRRPLMDIVGTGGDMTGTFNISTATSFVVAAAGINVAKHGNRSVSSKCGSAEVIEALDIPLLEEPSEVADCLEKTGFCFFFAPYFHKAMKNVVPVRKSLAARTIFNVLGPLANPAAPEHQLTGVYSAELVRPITEVLKLLGLERAMVVHGDGGMDELSLSGPTKVSFLADGTIEDMEFFPEDAGLNRAEAGFAAGGNAQENCRIIKNILSGKRGTQRDVVVYNAAASLLTADRVKNLKEGARMAEEIIDQGLAEAKLQEIRNKFRTKVEGVA